MGQGSRAGWRVSCHLEVEKLHAQVGNGDDEVDYAGPQSCIPLLRTSALFSMALEEELGVPVVVKRETRQTKLQGLA